MDILREVVTPRHMETGMDIDIEDIGDLDLTIGDRGSGGWDRPGQDRLGSGECRLQIGEDHLENGVCLHHTGALRHHGVLHLNTGPSLLRSTIPHLTLLKFLPITTKYPETQVQLTVVL